MLLNKNKDKQIFQSELTKYGTLQTKLSSNIDSHKQFLNDIVSEFKRLLENSEALRVIEARSREKNRIFLEWKVHYDRYKKAKDGLRRGRVFYNDLKSSLEELKSKVVKFVNQRNAERVALEKKIEADFAEHGQQAIKEQLRQLAIDSAVNQSSHNNRQSTAPVVSPQPYIPSSSGSVIPEVSRTPIPVIRSTHSAFQRETPVSGLGIDHLPVSNTLVNQPREFFDEQQYNSIESRKQS